MLQKWNSQLNVRMSDTYLSLEWDFVSILCQFYVNFWVKWDFLPIRSRAVEKLQSLFHLYVGQSSKVTEKRHSLWLLSQFEGISASGVYRCLSGIRLSVGSEWHWNWIMPSKVAVLVWLLHTCPHLKTNDIFLWAIMNFCK